MKKDKLENSTYGMIFKIVFLRKKSEKNILKSIINNYFWVLKLRMIFIAFLVYFLVFP